MPTNKLAKEILKAGVSEPFDGILVPIVNNYFIATGRHAQHTDEKGLEIINSLMEEQNRRIDERKVRKTFSASSSARCMREQMLNTRLGLKGIKEPDTRLINIFDDGFWRNLRWILNFHRMGILKEYEKSSYDKKTNISWTPDCKVDLSAYYGDEYNNVPVEIKGMHTGEFGEFLKKTGRSRWAASRTMQVHAYMLAEGEKNWLIWAEDKNTQNFEEYWMPRDPVIIKYLKRRYKYMNEAVTQGVLPAIECDMDPADPKYVRCDRSKECSKLASEGYPSLRGMKDRVLLEKKAARAFV